MLLTYYYVFPIIIINSLFNIPQISLITINIFSTCNINLLSNTLSSNSIQVKIENIKYVNKILFHLLSKIKSLHLLKIVYINIQRCNFTAIFYRKTLHVIIFYNMHA